MKLLSLLIMLSFLQAAWAADFTLTTTSFDPSKRIPTKHIFNGFGCTGENKSPALAWKNPPSGTKSFLITVYDPDAPTGSGWWHWTVANIPANVRKIPEGASEHQKLPKNVIEGRNDYGKASYGGPCPPIADRPHRYVFTIYALNRETVDVNAESSGAVMGFNAKQNSLGEASFTSRYGR
jgi:Raf kinase inhibitor-like YbhB/YbcL family protein